MPVELNIFLLLFGGLQGVFLSFLLLKNKLRRNEYLWLVVYLSVMIFQIVLKVMSKVWLMENLGALYSLTYQFPFLYGPLVYLFIRQFLSQRSFRVVDSLHFLSFGLALFYTSLENNINTGVFISKLFAYPQYRLAGEFVSLVIYHSLAWGCWKRYHNDTKNNVSEITGLRLRWLKHYIVFSFIICLFITVVIFLMYQWFPFHQDIRFGFIALTIFIYWISYCAWNQPQLFRSINEISNTEELHGNKISAPVLTVHWPVKKYANSGLGKENMDAIIAKLAQVMEKDKLYLDPEITVTCIADTIGCSRHHLSQVLNDGLGKSFYDYINLYRVEEAKLLLVDSKSSCHKIASIAYDAGFNSLSAFNDVFKKITSLTPSQYRKQWLQEKQQRQRV